VRNLLQTLFLTNSDKVKRRFIVYLTNRWLFSILVSVLFLCIFASVEANAAGQKVLPGQVPPAAAKSHWIKKLAATNELGLTLGLPLRHEAELDELLRQQYDPASTNFHKFLTPAEFAARFGPAEADYQNVIGYARSNHLRVVAMHPNRLGLDVVAPVADIEGAFHVSLHTYQHPTEAREYYAPDGDPTLPAGLNVLSIEGLDNFSRPRYAGLKMMAVSAHPAAFNGTGPNSEYAGNDFRNAYVPGSALTGSGQSVALLEYSDYYPVDITNYENIVGAINGATNYVPLVNKVVNGSAPGTAQNIEVALDIEMVISMAPGLSQVYVYEQSMTSSSLLNQIASDNLAKQVASSWSVGNWNSPTAATYDSILKNMAAQGQSFFQASMDNDAFTGSQPLDSGTTLPEDSPYATVVGGTTLSMGNSAWSSETVWNYNSTVANEGSGGGISAYYSRPYWQTNISMAANSGSTAYRNIPDVALTADDIFISYGNGNYNGYSYAMGTSAAAPLWAGFCALANQLSVASNGTTLGFLNPALYNAALSSCYANSFHDITTGNNIGTNTAGLFYAVAGYDLCTGLGTPAGTNLINALVWPPPVFTNQPAGRTVTNGANVTLTAAASSTTAIGYNWLCNGTNLAAGGNVSGVAANTLSLAGATTNNNGSYQLAASNLTGSVTSLVAVVAVVVAPAVSVAPASLTLLAGSNAVFTATASGTAPLGYRWRRNGTNVAGANLTGTNASVLTITSATTNNAGNYSVVMTNVLGGVTSSVAPLVVVLPPVIASSSVTNRTAECGSNNLTFAVTVKGTTPLAVQWSLDGAAVAGATNTSYAVTNLYYGSHAISVVITNPYASISSNAVITVKDSMAPVITLQGSNPMTVELGRAFSDPGATAVDACVGAVTVTASGSVKINAVGTNTITYTAGDGNGNTNTATRTVVVRDTTAPAIVWSFTNLVLAADANCVAAMPVVTGTNYIIATDLSGSVTNSQSPTNEAVLPLGTNWVVITVQDGSGNTAWSTNTIVVQDQTPPVIAVQPLSQTNRPGASVSFSVAAAACTPLQYQWYFAGGALDGQTNSGLTLSNLVWSSAGDYLAVVTGAGGSMTSAVAILAVVVAPGIDSVTVPPSGWVVLGLSGVPGDTYIVEAATNLLPPVNWWPLATNTLGTNGVWQFTDEQSTNFNQQYYRLLLAP